MPLWLKRFLRHTVRYPIEAFFTGALYLLGRSLPITWASSIGAFLLRSVGPLSKAHKTALKNLSWALPNLTDQERSNTVMGVWDNFGRVMGEYPNIYDIDFYNDDRIEVIGTDVIDQLKNDGKPAIIFGAHLASWEVAIIAAAQRGLNMTQMYRATNNPWVDKIVMYAQGRGKQNILTKGRGDAKNILDALDDGTHFFILVDQKMNRGISVPFFGRDAMTAPAAARMAIKYNCPLVPAQVERLGGFKFRVTYHPPIDIPDTGDAHADTKAAMVKVNQMIEDWVRQHPDQWLWVHNRWPKDKK
ncbi:MAG: lauroyl acyltransferase [Alphaproteobacteria bacterium]